MALKVYLFKYDQLLPIILLASNTVSKSEEELYNNYYENFYEILFSKNIISDKTILIFCNFKNESMKKQLQIQGSINSDKDILNHLESNIKNIEFVINEIIKNYSANYCIELSDTIKIKSTNTRLNLFLKVN